MTGTETARLQNETWLVVPLYNEATVIAQVIEETRKVFPNIVCVDDGSSDGSSVLAEKAGAWVVQHPINLGQGAALQTGISWALTYTRASYLVTFDADGQHRTSDALAMVERADRENLGFVLGSRFLSGPSQAGFLKRMVLRTAAKLGKLSHGLDLTDSHNGLRVLSRRTAQELHLSQNRMAHAGEIVNQLAATGHAWAEHPVTIDYTDYSRSKGQSLLNGVNILTEQFIGTSSR